MKKLLLLGAALAALAIPVGASASTITQVMHGLDNPKGLALGPEGGLSSPKAAGAGRRRGNAGRARGRTSASAATARPARSRATGMALRHAS